MHAQVDTSVVDPAGHWDVLMALELQVLQAAQKVPVPEYPALHWHTATSAVDPTPHWVIRAPFASHCVQAKQTMPRAVVW